MARRESSEGRLPLRPSSVTSKGQATIPADVRRALNIGPGDRVLFRVEGGQGLFEKVQEIDEVWNAGQSAMLSEWNDPEQDVYNDWQSMESCESTFPPSLTSRPLKSVPLSF